MVPLRGPIPGFIPSFPAGPAEHQRHTVDGRNPAPLKKPWSDDSPCRCQRTVAFHGFLGGAGFCSSTVAHPKVRNTCRSLDSAEPQELLKILAQASKPVTIRRGSFQPRLRPAPVVLLFEGSLQNRLPKNGAHSFSPWLLGVWESMINLREVRDTPKFPQNTRGALNVPCPLVGKRVVLPLPEAALVLVHPDLRCLCSF